MKDAAGTDLHHHEDVKALKASGDRDHEVARQQGSGVIADKYVPALRAPVGPWFLCRPVCSHRARRDADTELEP